MKIIEVIETIKFFHQPYIWSDNTRDKVLCGDVQKECTGVAVTCCATYEVIKKCAERKLNLIISHEGITYNYEKKYDINCFENEVVRKKIDYAYDNDIVIWRDHDAMHGPFPKNNIREKTDLIFYGTMKELGWEKYLIGDEKKPLWYKIPPIKAEKLGALLIEKWNLNGLRIVGNLDSTISMVYMCEHVTGGEKDIAILDNCAKAEAIIPLEICDYTVTTYVRDAAAMGMNKVIFEMGHFNAEELGMKYLANILSDIFVNRCPVEFIQSGDGFDYLLK
ncbi:MAG: Nif3-like dinuclear metal center hexameric protein [Erysipelotrichia bacterium]|nr:Nif3-like dinuclear metal center hexameric protein [Erysipelotrichia bacterium]